MGSRDNWKDVLIQVLHFILAARRFSGLSAMRTAKHFINGNLKYKVEKTAYASSQPSHLHDGNHLSPQTPRFHPRPPEQRQGVLSLHAPLLGAFKTKN